ncbi:interleukin-1 receptor-associated kinase 1 isoform X2 [Pristis pectinata]|uniref:interleukin-1 receptor-associated kinase 1 isoform X2 n=1 Tax=Pristis pectinata TaxID=685728 RepID=UPI00223DEF99|nr:interleukin-1 receptor-associated kinase 1 isoform X2 [Pristis pectinata]
MSGWDPGQEFIHRLPAAVMHRFCSVMDSLDSADWGRFASYIVSDVTDLRLLEIRGDVGRTQNVMWYWMNRNGTVGQLLHVLTSLNLWRARDIILSWRPPVHPPWPNAAPARPIPYLPAAEPLSAATPLSSRPNSEKSFNGKLSDRETVTFDSPVPSKSVPKNELPRPSTPPDSLFTDPSKDPPVSRPMSPPCVRKNVFHWPLSELKNGTHNFAERQKIGEGGFGCVYHALMRHTEYAVKRLKEDSNLDWKTVRESFYTELEKLYQYRHPNIMDLAGCCVEDGVYCLVYTYMSNGSLQERLQCQDGTPPLSWLRRLEVLLGAARAIQFLHGSTPSLIHGDVKSSNILLDENFVPKLGDFGLACFSRYSNTSGKSCTVARTRTLRGTLAYLPDEYIKSGQLAVELDTYSFGVVLLEILTGRKALENEGSGKYEYLKDIIEEEEEKEDEEESAGRTDSAVARGRRVAARVCRRHLDQRAGACPQEVPLQLCMLATECLNHKRKRRPKMTKVYEKLEELRDALRTPSRQEAPLSLSASSDGDGCVSELSDRLQRGSLSPVQNTYRFGGDSGDSGTAPHWQPAPDTPFSAGGSDLCSALEALAAWRPPPGGLRQPVESEESSTDHGGGSCWGGPSGAGWSCQMGMETAAPVPAPPLTDSPCWPPSGVSWPPVSGDPRGAHTSLSADSQESGSWVSRRAPEESDEFN